MTGLYINTHTHTHTHTHTYIFPGSSVLANAGYTELIPGSGSSPGKGDGNPPQYSHLGNPMDGGAWWATVHGVAESDTT